MSLPELSVLDSDGAIRETEAAVAGDTRASFFKKAAVGGGAVVGAGFFTGLLPELAAAAKPSKKQDLAILNFALTLEELESAFYNEAVSSGGLSGAQLDLARLITAHEATHVKTLRSVIKALGGKAVKKPTFDFKGTNKGAKFIGTALVLENTGVHAYLGQAGNLQNKKLLAAAAAIVTIEARHASAVAVLNNSSPFGDKTGGSVTPNGAFDTPKSKKAILSAVGKTGFITG